MKTIFRKKYSLIEHKKETKNEKDEKSFKSNFYLVEKTDPYLMAEIIPKDLEEKIMIMTLIEKK